MQKLEGIAVSPGVAIGEALVMDNEGFRIPHRFVTRDAVEDECERLGAAIGAAAGEIAANRDAVAKELGEQYGAIFGAHLQMVNDAKLRGEIEEMIRTRHYSPEYAVSRALRRYAKVFQSLDSSTLAQRTTDIFDIEKRLLKHLLGRKREELAHLASPVTILAHTLTPSETASLNRDFALGFVTETGGPGSHTAIVAEAMEIPAVVGVGPFLTDVSGGEMVIVDGDQGLVILQPDEETIAHYRHEVEEHRTLAERLLELADKPAVTQDGTQVGVLGNIEFPYEVKWCNSRGADGVGLYRTEFLYLNAEFEPTEETHFEAYSKVLQAIGGKPVCIRTLDLGADKLRNLPMPEDERNPVLGLRSIRLALRNVELFRTQLRAVLRASALGKTRIMFPLITKMQELRQAKMLLTDVMEDLEEHNIAFDRGIEVGMMVEVPAAVILIDRFVEEVDFISIGTNDLIQYTLAVDRGNKNVANLYTAADPAVLRQIDATLKAANKAGIPANLCGQMSSNTIYTMLLLGLGLRQFSVPPAAILEIKRVIRAANIEQCEQIAERVKEMESSAAIRNFLKEELKKVVPEFVP
jgi:phosphotransferase system enzyme I (PtsI)